MISRKIGTAPAVPDLAASHHFAGRRRCVVCAGAGGSTDHAKVVIEGRQMRDFVGFVADSY